MVSPTLSYCEESLPGESFAERLEWIRRYDLALEIANRGEHRVETYRQASVQITAVQAYEMHDFHPIHLDPERRSQALPHVIETLELAAELGAPRIVTVCGFGNDIADQPMKRCVEFFQSCVNRAKDLGIRIMIEPLSPRRCAALNHPDEVYQLIQTLNEPEVFSLMLDTGHLWHGDIDLDVFFQDWHQPVEELQIKGLHSAPPDPNMPLQRWINALPIPPAVINVEHRQAIAPQTFSTLIQSLQQTLRQRSMTHGSSQ